MCQKVVCVCVCVISLSLPPCRRRRGRCGTVDSLLQTRGPRPARSADQLQQERAAGPLPGIQKRQWIHHCLAFRMCVCVCFVEMRLCFILSLQECPRGVVDEETFKNIYSQFFPQGGPARPLLSTFQQLSFRTKRELSGSAQISSSDLIAQKVCFSVTHQILSPCHGVVRWKSLESSQYLNILKTDEIAP